MSQDGNRGRRAKMNADKPEAGEAVHPDAAKEARAQLSSEDFRILLVLG